LNTKHINVQYFSGVTFLQSVKKFQS